jgi:small subunit ribosomal protein S9
MIYNNSACASATGRRKKAIASVRLILGSGLFSVNGKKMSDYFSSAVLKKTVLQPFELFDISNKFDVVCKVIGGGLTGQAEAIRHGISRALNNLDTEKYRHDLKLYGFLTRDPRMKERKKYGLKAARKRPQFSKR